MFKLRNRESLFSKLTIILSSVCIVHCLSMPLLILMLPTVATFLSSTVELILILSIIPLSIASFFPRWLRHRNYNRLYIFLIGLSLIIIAQLFWHNTHSNMEFSDILGLSGLFAGVIMVSGVIYTQNRHTHECSNPEHSHCHHH